MLKHGEERITKQGRRVGMGSLLDKIANTANTGHGMGEGIVRKSVKVSNEIIGILLTETKKPYVLCKKVCRACN